jgi:HEAT repeat protein
MKCVLSTLALIAIVSSISCSRGDESAGGATEESAAATRPAAGALDMSDLGKVRRQFDEMSADQAGQYLIDPKSQEFGLALRSMRKKGHAAIPHMVKLMARGDLGVHWRAPQLTILALGDTALPVLIKLIDSENPHTRMKAVWALEERQEPCKAAIEPLLRVLRSGEQDLAERAARALACNGKGAAAAVGHMIPLAFKVPWQSHGVCRSVDAIGLSPDWIPSVIQHVAIAESNPKNTDFRVFVGARLLAAAGKDGTAGITDALAHSSPAVRRAAAQAVGELKTQARTEAMEKALNAALGDDTVRVDAAAALIAIGASAKRAVAGLIRNLESGEVSILRTTQLRYTCPAADVLARIPEALPKLIDGLNSDKEIVRIGCIRAMPTAKASSRLVASKLKELLARSKSQREQEFIVMKLHQVDPAWLRRAAGGLNATRWPPTHWHAATRTAVATVRAEK